MSRRKWPAIRSCHATAGSRPRNPTKLPEAFFGVTVARQTDCLATPVFSSHLALADPKQGFHKPSWAGDRTVGGRPIMTNSWQYQIRINLADPFAEMARSDPGNPALKPLTDILARHNAAAQCQFDAFAAYVAEAEKHGVEQFPLYKWTKATIEDSAKKEKYLKSFTLYVDGEEVYAKERADALESDLQPLVGGGLITKLSKHDTNPANNPQAPAHLR
jgi:hypothetical protein